MPMLLSISLTLLLALVSVENSAVAEMIDLRRAVVVAPDDRPIVNTAKRMLSEEIEKRTGITLTVSRALGSEAGPVVLLCRSDEVPAQLREFAEAMNVPEQAEGFAIASQSDGKQPVVVLAGNDDRGVLFAVGRLLLNTRMGDGQLELPSEYRVATAPRYPHRGHQIAFRNLAHCYDAWTPDTYEQYMRELAVFGANAFETTRFSIDGRDGPHAKLTGGGMAKEWSRICDDYGFDFWLFTSAIGGQGHSDEQERAAIESQLENLRAIPHLDHIYLTGGDGGTSHARPDLMFEWTGKFAEEARKIHPDLGVWVSNQGFGPELNNWFFDYLQREQPEWVTGVAYGPWSRVLLDEQRARIPEQYPIRRYPDIGHCVRGQYSVPGWDRAFAQTLGREPFCPRPRDHARIHNLFDQYCDGFVTYSDGVGDDLNKFVWTALGWDPDQDLDGLVLDYARFHFGWDIGERVRDGLFMFEDAFAGPLAENEGVERNFAHWRALEQEADEELLANWRFQECLLRAYYDHYTRLRLLKANADEECAMATLRKAPQIGVEQAVTQAKTILSESDQDQTTDVLKARIIELGAELFESIGAQLDVETYQARSDERGAVLDFLDTPLNNRLWLEDELDAILAGRFTATMPENAGSGDVRLARLARVTDWEDPGPGGFYDDLGCAWKQPHLVKPKPQSDDPAGVTTPREAHYRGNPERHRLSWIDYSEALYATPLTMRYTELDPDAAYRIRVTYLGRYSATIRLVADDEFEIHGPYGHTVEGVRYTSGYSDQAAVVTQGKDDPRAEVTPLEFVIPREATQDGKLELTWQRVTGRGTQVAEIWLIKQPPQTP